MYRLLLNFALAAVLAAPVSGCKRKAPPVVALTPVSDAEATKFADRLMATLEPCDPDALQKLLDLKTLMRIALAGSNAPARERSSFAAGVQRGRSNFAREMCADEDGHYDLLRIKELGKHRSVLVRGYGESGINFVEFFISKNKDGKVVAHDLFSFMSGERFSATMRNLFDRIIDDRANRSNMRSATTDMVAIQRLRAEGQFAQARSRVRELPDSIRLSKAMMLIDVQMASNLDDASYDRAIQAFEMRFPDSPALDLVSLDRHYIREEYDKVIEKLERLDQRVGGDPYLAYLRAAALVELERPADARTVVSDVIARAPHLEDPYWLRINLDLEAGRFADVAADLTTLQRDLDIELDVEYLRSEAEYAGFAASPEGRALLESLEK